MAAPRKYPDELRERAIRLTLDARKDPASRPGACARIGEQLLVNPETLRGWVTQAEINEGQRPGTTTSDADKLDKLEREVKGCVGRTRSCVRRRPFWALLTSMWVRIGVERSEDAVTQGIRRHEVGL
jgi:transposase